MARPPWSMRCSVSREHFAQLSGWPSACSTPATWSGTRRETCTRGLATTTSRMMRSLMAGSRRSAELDSDSAHGVEVPRLLSRLPELAAQPRDMNGYRLVGPAVGYAPHVGEQVPPGDHLAGVQREVVQQVELPPAQVQGGAVQGRHVRADVQPEPADLQR